MASMRRIGTERSKTRGLLLEAAEELMRAEGYAAVTSRRLAAHAGLKPQLVHYYFRTMDDLFLELFNRTAEQYLARQSALLDAPEPLAALWDISFDRQWGVLAAEFVALANHRKAIGAAIAEFGERSRKIVTEILTRVFVEKHVDTAKWPPVALAFTMECIARSLVSEIALGMSSGHKEFLELFPRFVEQLSER